MIRIDDTPTRYVTVVIGAGGVQHRLVLYPGGALPDTLVDWRPGAPTPVPAGSILFYLDPPAEAPPDSVRKPPGTGWPADADLTPVWLTTGQHGPADLDRAAVQRLTLAIAASLATTANPTTVDRPPEPAPWLPTGRAPTPSSHHVAPAAHR